jgi:hypothetical protein
MATDSDEVSTSDSDRVSIHATVEIGQDDDPVAIAPGSDFITQPSEHKKLLSLRSTARQSAICQGRGR